MNDKEREKLERHIEALDRVIADLTELESLAFLTHQVDKLRRL